MTLTSRYGDELSISLRQSSSFCRVACPRRPATRPSTVRTCPVMPSAYRGVIGARFGRLQMGFRAAARVPWPEASVVPVPPRRAGGTGNSRDGRRQAAFAGTEGVPAGSSPCCPTSRRASRFYGELFGWTFGAPEQGRHGYTEARIGASRVAAAHRASRTGGCPPSGGLYLRDRRRAWPPPPRRARRRSDHHAALPGGRRGHLRRDRRPRGAVFRSVAGSRTRPDSSAPARPGAYGWAELYTRDTEQADAFYTTVFGYGTRDLTDVVGDGFGRVDARGRPGRRRARRLGRGRVADRYPEPMPPHFLAVLRSRRLRRAPSTAATGLGGRVLRGAGAFALRPVTRCSSDDQGAAFAVIAPDDEAEGLS